MKECDGGQNWFHEVCEDFNCEGQISKVNSKNQWFSRYCIGIHQLPYEINDNVFVNLCLENEEMHSIIALVRNKWSRHISKEFIDKEKFLWLDKEFKENEWSDENKRKYSTPFSIVSWFFDCGRCYKIEKGYRRSTRGTVGVYLDLKASISLHCRNCERRRFHLNWDDKSQEYQETNSEEGVLDD